MASANGPYEDVLRVVTARHSAKVAELAKISAEIARLDAALAALRKGPVAEDALALAAISARSRWALRREAQLLKEKERLQALRQKARAAAAFSHGQEHAAQRLAKDAEKADQLEAERKTERAQTLLTLLQKPPRS